MSKLTLNVSKEEFENRVAAALEGAMKSPLKKQRTQVLNAAMVQILHGGNGVGQNEHNLNQFWGEDTAAPEKAYHWVGTDNYRHETCYDDRMYTVTGHSEIEVKRQLYKNVLSDLAHTVSMSIDTETFLNLISNTDFFVNYLEDNNKESNEIDEHDVANLIDTSFKLPLDTQESVFNYVTGLSSVEGTHTIEEVEVKPIQPAKAPVETKRTITIHTIIKKDKAEGQDSGIDDVSIYTTLNAKEHDEQLIGFFRQYSEESASFGKDDLLEHRVTEDVMSDADLEAEDFDDKDFGQIIDWLCEHGRPNLLVEMIPDMTFGLYEIDVEYKQEEI